MTGRSRSLVSLVPGLLAIGYSAATHGGENNPKEWCPGKAIQFLDRRGEDWFNFAGAHRGQGASATTCVSCHSLLPFALARPVVRRLLHEKEPTKLEAKILEQAKHR